MESIEKFANLHHVSEAWWTEVCKKVKNAIVFIDTPISECLHWNGGLERLISAGTRNVKEFSSFEKASNLDQKGVFLINGLIKDVPYDILKDIITASQLQYCIIIATAHPMVLSYAKHPGREVDAVTITNQLEQDVLNWMGNMNFSVEILHFPIVFAPIIDGVCLMPGYSNLFPLLDSDLPKINNFQQDFSRAEKTKPLQNLGEVDWQHLPLRFRCKIRQFVVNLHSLLQGMNAREEIFTLGHTSRIIGSDLESFLPARQRRKAASHKVSLVLMDRTLDLMTPTSYVDSTLMDRILNLLPRLPGHKTDSAINMFPISEVHPSCEWTLLPGCFHHEGDQRTSHALKLISTSDVKSAFHFINKQVIKAAEQIPEINSSNIKKKHVFSPSNLKENIQLFASHSESFSNNIGLLQQGLGVVEALTHEGYPHLDQLLSLQKSLLQSINDKDETPPFTQILQLLKTRASRKVKLENILALLVHLASLNGPESLPQTLHYSLTNSLSQAILQDKSSLSDSVLSLVGRDVDEISALKTSQCITDRLQGITTARDHLTNYKNLYEPGDDVQPATANSLIELLARDCLTINQAEIPDLEYKSAGLKDFIKSGFSLFVNVSKPMPRDAAVMMLVVIGGISPSEVKAIREVVKELQPQCEVIILSSHFTCPSEIIMQALSHNALLAQI